MALIRWSVAVSSQRARGDARGLFTYWVLVAESEHKSVSVWVERVVVENLDVEVPGLKVIGGHKGYSSWEVVGDLEGHSQVSSKEVNRRSNVMAGLERGSKLSMTQLCGGFARRHKHTFVSSFPSRLCAKLAPIVNVGSCRCWWRWNGAVEYQKTPATYVRVR